MGKTASILFCRCCCSDIINSRTKSEVLAHLKDRGFAFEEVEDLCRAAKQRHQLLADFARQDNAVVIACFPRAVKWLFHWAGAPLNENKVSCLNMRTHSAEEIICRLKKLPVEPGPANKAPEHSQDNWIPWFPVIDYDRCKNCKQCLNFCLFGVYRQSDDGRIFVSNPANCKTNCPACARMCPQQAIIFPKYEHAPVNGAVPEATLPENTKQNLQSLASGDVYEMIRNRGKHSIETLRAMADELDIPKEYLASLKDSDSPPGTTQQSDGNG